MMRISLFAALRNPVTKRSGHVSRLLFGSSHQLHLGGIFAQEMLLRNYGFQRVRQCEYAHIPRTSGRMQDAVSASGILH